MPPTLVMLSSPLLGPSVWEPVATELRRAGWSAMIAPTSPSAPASPDDVLQGFCAAVPHDRDVVLVPHSNAGLYVPALVQRRRVVGAVFVDAGLPPAGGEVALAPPDLFAVLADKADVNGMLSPWTGWWDQDVVAGLFPDAETRERVEREQSRLPLSYFAASLHVQSGWDTGLAGAYLAFGDTYADDRARAVGRVWPTTTMPGRHLNMLVDPAGVAEELQRLLSRIGLGR